MKKTLITTGLFCAAMSFAAEAVTNVPFIKAPVLDGIIQDAEWSNAISGEFRNHDDNSVPVNPSKYYVGCDGTNMYFAFKCFENSIQSMRRVFTHIEERDSNIFSDDCIEIIGEQYGIENGGNLHFAVNSCGLIYDAYNGDVSYQSGIKVACKVEKDFWVVEALIPFRDLSIVPDGAQTIRLTLGRERHATPAEYSCTGNGTGSFHDHSRMTYFRPMPQNGAIPPVTILGFGTKAEHVLTIANSSADDKNAYIVKANTVDANGKAIREFTLKTNPEKSTQYEYRVEEKTPVVGYNMTVLPANGEGAPLYKFNYRFPGATAAAKLIAMPIEKPLFEELLSKDYPPQRDFHGFQWMFGAGMAGYMQQFALQNAIPHSVLAIGKEHKDTNMACYANVTMIKWLNEEAFCKRFNTPLAIMPRVLDRNVKSGVPHSLVILPEIRKLWLEDVRTAVSHKEVRILTFADESSEYLENGIIDFFAKNPQEEQIAALDAKIKEKYGQGKYGIPASIEESNPLAWIAYRRGLNEELVSLFRDAAELARSINPDIIIVSDDPVANVNRVYSFSDWKGICDIVTHQLYPRCSQNIDSFGFMTRYIAHLTEANEVWPCPHVEEYGASFTPQEVLYKLSATVRNGATGFHFYLDDTPGTRSGIKYLIHERWGAPDRYAVELNAQRLMSRLPRLAFPAYDCAMFVSADSLRAVPGLMLRRQVNDDIFLHGFLGYGAGVNYRIINELSLQHINDYKFVVTTTSDYVSTEAFNTLRKYVNDGGTLLVINPTAFGHTPEGTELPRAQFTGITGIGYSEAPVEFSFAGRKFSVGDIRCSKLSVAPEAKVLAQFANGDPAMVQMSIGKGRVITMAANPCISKLAGNDDWKKFFLLFSEECGAKTQCDIWRFQLPQSLLPKDEEIPGVCLTNNFVKWKSFKPTHANSSDVTGSYTLTPAPNFVKDANDGEVSFEKGKLTDRRRAVVAGAACKEKSSWVDWAIAWKDLEEPITIHCKWSEKKAVKSVKLLVSSVARDTRLSIAGKSYDFVCPADFNDDQLSVREIVISPDKPVEATELDIVFAPAKGRFTIAEMEIWAE